MKTLKPVRPNAGIEAAYRVCLRKLLKEMHDSVTFWISQQYRNDPPLMAMDAKQATPAMAKALKEVSGRWERKFNEAAPKVAAQFAGKVSKRSDESLRKLLKGAGFVVPFKPTPAMQDVLAATVHANVGLIKSIPQQYLKDVEGAVMRSIQQGRDLKSLASELQQAFGVSFRRAARIALDQNNKATSSLTRARKVSLGIKKERWRHSGGGKHPRPTHVRASKDEVTYDIRKGWYDPAVGRFIFPGEEPNCRCLGEPVIEGL